jgi:hypothetical protein
VIIEMIVCQFLAKNSFSGRNFLEDVIQDSRFHIYFDAR